MADPIEGHDVPQRKDEILSHRHMDHFGAQLFSRHLIAVEVAGTMLLAALVGAPWRSPFKASRPPARQEARAMGELRNYCKVTWSWERCSFRSAWSAC